MGGTLNLGVETLKGYIGNDSREKSPGDTNIYQLKKDAQEEVSRRLIGENAFKYFLLKARYPVKLVDEFLGRPALVSEDLIQQASNSNRFIFQMPECAEKIIFGCDFFKHLGIRIEFKGFNGFREEFIKRNFKYPLRRYAGKIVLCDYDILSGSEQLDSKEQNILVHSLEKREIIDPFLWMFKELTRRYFLEESPRRIFSRVADCAIISTLVDHDCKPLFRIDKADNKPKKGEFPIGITTVQFSDN